MARHSSMPRTDKAALRNQRRIGNELRGMTGDNKSLRFKDYGRLLSEAVHDIGIRQRLNADVDKGGDKAVTARRKLRELRDVKYYVDKPVAAGEMHNDSLAPSFKAKPARGSSGKHNNLLRGKAARDSQGKGI